MKNQKKLENLRKKIIKFFGDSFEGVSIVSTKLSYKNLKIPPISYSKPSKSVTHDAFLVHGTGRKSQRTGAITNLVLEKTFLKDFL